MSAPALPKRGFTAPGLRNDPIPVVENVVVWIAALFAMVATLATLSIVGVFIASVVSRWAGHPFDVTNWVSGLLVVATFCGMAWTTVRGEHVSVQVVTERFKPSWNRVLDIVIWSLATAYLVWLIVVAFQKAWDATFVNVDIVDTGIDKFQKWPFRWVFAIAMVPFAMVSAVNLVRGIIGRRPYDDVMSVGEQVSKETAGEVAADDVESTDTTSTDTTSAEEAAK